MHNYVAPQTETRLSPIHGLGLFAKKPIKKGEVVAAWGGKVTTEAELEKLPKDIGFHYALELYPGLYLAERCRDELDSADFINHCCRPSCRIKDRFVLITRRDIEKGEELTADFSSKAGQGKSFACRCGAPACKGVVYFA